MYILCVNCKTIIFKKVVQNIFDGRVKFCFNINEHSDSVISGPVNDFCNAISFIFKGLSSMIFSPVIPIVLLYSELPVL